MVFVEENVYNFYNSPPTLVVLSLGNHKCYILTEDPGTLLRSQTQIPWMCPDIASGNIWPQTYSSVSLLCCFPERPGFSCKSKLCT